MRLTLFPMAALLTVVTLSGCAKDSSDDGGDDTSTPDVIDDDGDGVPAEEDCDDGNAELGAVTEDADCDGALTAEDCDDSDESSTIVAEDGDCDGILTEDDCNDADAASTSVAEDGDCDGTLTDDDCDDSDAASTSVAEDGDCDGILTGQDCDDSDAASTSVAEDGDCDGTLTGDDCDDNDSSLNLDDVDSDGYSSCDGDCDDQRSGFNPGASDGLISDRDCDGVVSGGSLSLADYKYVGENNQDYSGFPVSSAGDVDGDGRDDLLIGGYRNDAGGVDSGAAYIVLASSLGSGGTINLSNADYKLVGESTSDRAGVSLASAGDVDGDGLDDVLVGADANGAGGVGAGAAYIVLGSSLGSNSTIDLADADYKFVGEAVNDSAGSSVSSAGDLDGDGLDDVLIGAPYDDERGLNSGAVYIVLASSLGSSSTIDLSDADYKVVGEEDSGFGNNGSVSSAGDVDGDGLADALLGAWSDDEGGYAAGAAYIVLGSTLGSISTLDFSDADYKLLGEEVLDFTGQYVASAGDVDGDSLSDVMVGSYRNDAGGVDAGAAYIVLGSSLATSGTIDLYDADYKLVGEVAGDYAGSAISSAGDVDGDGLSDVMVGAFLYTNVGISSGMAYLILGSSLGTSSTIDLSNADYRMEGESGFDYAGGSVSSAGDVDGDGLDDVLVGSAGDQGYHAGEAFLILTGG